MSITARGLAVWLAAGLVVACATSDHPRAPIPDANPERVIAFAPSIVEYLYAMDLEDRIVGVSAYCDFPPEASRHPVMGHATEPDYERLLGARPDLILGIGEAAKLMTLAERLAVPARAIPLDSIEEILAAPRIIGDLLGEERAGAALSESIEGELEAVAASDPGSVAPSVLIVIGRAEKEVFSTGRDTFLTQLVAIAGGRSVTADREKPWFNLDWEQVLSLQPEVILIFESRDGVSEDARAELASIWQRFDSLPAVRHGRVHVLTGSHMLKSGPRVGQAARDIAAALAAETP